LGFEDDHDTFVSVWDSASNALERSARKTLREFSMTDAAVAFGNAARLAFSPGDAEALGQSYVEEWARHVTPLPGVPDLIRQLAEHHAIAIVSNTHDPSMVPRMLDEMGVASEVSAVVLSVEHGWLKPHDSIYAAALERVRCTAEQAVFVGDSYEADYSAPMRAGMSAFLIDPANEHDIPPRHRLTTVVEIAAAISRSA
jgi:putative hydrolase of the HAD superfamily